MSQTLDKRLHTAIEKLNDSQKREVLIFVRDFLEQDTDISGKWNDEDFIAEMESRANHYKNGGLMVSSKEADRLVKEMLEKAANR